MKKVDNNFRKFQSQLIERNNKNLEVIELVQIISMLYFSVIVFSLQFNNNNNSSTAHNNEQ